MRRQDVAVLRRCRLLSRRETPEIQSQAAAAHPDIDEALETGGLRGIFDVLLVASLLRIVDVDAGGGLVLIAAVEAHESPQPREALAVDVASEIECQAAGIAVARLRILGGQHAGAAVVDAREAESGGIALVLQRAVAQ